MIDREKVIKGLECCVADSMACGNGKPFEDCPYLDAKDEILDCCGVLMRDALTLLKEQEDSIRLKPLAEWLAGYAAPPRDAMRAAMQDGHITPGILRQAWEQTLREIRWDEVT